MTIDFTIKDSDPGSTGLTQTFTTLPSQQLAMILVGDAFIRLIPFVFAFLSLALKNDCIHWMNLILGFIFAIFAFFGFITLLLQFTNIKAYEIVIQVVTIISPILISWYAYRWPKEENKKSYLPAEGMSSF